MFSFVFPVNFSTSEKSQAAWSNSFHIYGKYTLQIFEFIFIFLICFFLYLSKKEEILKPETMNKCATINMFLIFVVIVSIVHLSESIAIREAGGPHWNAIHRSHGIKEKNDNDENTYGDKTDSAPTFPRKRNYEPCACPRMYWPVCGSDRMTYSNKCELQCAQNQTYGRSCNLRSLGEGTCDEFDFSSKA